MDSKSLVQTENILRSIHIDNDYINHGNLKLVSLLERLSNFYALNINANKTDILSKCTYYISSYLLSKSTPGEEYLNISIHFRHNKIILYILLLSIERFLINQIHSIIKLKVNALRDGKFRLLYEIFENLSLEDMASKFEEIQLAIFFLTGKFFYHMLFSIDYKSKLMTPQIIDNNSFKILSWLTTLKLGLELGKILWNRSTLIQTNKEQCIGANLKLKKTNITPTNDTMCLLCLETRTDTSSTSCGHLFCWKCITDYLQSNPQCPLCRRECLPQHIVYLRNYN